MPKPEPLGFVCGLHDLQEKGEMPNPVYEDLIAQTSGGVLNAIDSFVNRFCRIEDRGEIFEAIEARRRDLLGMGVLTFKYEFLSLSKMLECGGLIVIVVARGQIVKSVDTWEHGALAPRALDYDGARERFARGMVTVVISPEAGTIKYMCRPYPNEHLRLAPTLKEQPHNPKRASTAGSAAEQEEEEEEPSARVREMRALIHGARAALRPETAALPPVSSK